MTQIKHIALWMMLLIPTLALAQDFSWMEKAPEKYLASATQLVINPASPCNQGEEAFMDFIPKFRSDKKFRDSRMKFDDNEEMYVMSMESLADWNNGNGYALFKAQKRKRYYCTWYDVTANQVCFKMEDYPSGEWGGSSMMARFQRIGGKWYITAIMMAG